MKNESWIVARLAVASRRLLPCLALIVSALGLSLGVVEAQSGPCPPDPVAARPSPIGPAGTIYHTRPTFSWYGVPGYTAYVFKLLYASPNETYVNPPGGLVYLEGTSWTPPSDLPVGVGMRWSVKVVCDAGGGPAYSYYSDERFFDIAIDEPPPPPPDACGQCFGGLQSCLEGCPSYGVCERRVLCGESGYKCFC